MTPTPRKGIGEAGEPRKSEEGFTLIELVIATLVLIIAVLSLTTVLVNSLTDSTYARQRLAASNLANQTVEEIRALPWADIDLGMSSSDISGSGDANISGNCFEGQPLDVGGTVTGSACALGSTTFTKASCLSASPLSSPPSASSLGTTQVGSVTYYAPIDPHQACYQVGTYKFGVDVYITGATGESYTSGTNTVPLTATVVVSWAQPLRGGLSTYILTTTELSDCLKGNSLCAVNAQT
jgi:Tfp pilus assembly protein PilV